MAAPSAGGEVDDGTVVSVGVVSSTTGAGTVSGGGGSSAGGWSTVEPAHGGAQVYGLVHGPRPQKTHRSLAASAQACSEVFTESVVQPRRPSEPCGANIPDRALSWKVQCESSLVRTLTLTAS